MNDMLRMYQAACRAVGWISDQQLGNTMRTSATKTAGRGFKHHEKTALQRGQYAHSCTDRATQQARTARYRVGERSASHLMHVHAPLSTRAMQSERTTIMGQVCMTLRRTVGRPDRLLNAGTFKGSDKQWADAHDSGDPCGTDL